LIGGSIVLTGAAIYAISKLAGCGDTPKIESKYSNASIKQQTITKQFAKDSAYTVAKGDNLWNVVKNVYGLTDNTEISLAVNDVVDYNQNGSKAKQLSIDNKAVVNGKVVHKADGIKGDVIYVGDVISLPNAGVGYEEHKVFYLTATDKKTGKTSYFAPDLKTGKELVEMDAKQFGSYLTSTQLLLKVGQDIGFSAGKNAPKLEDGVKQSFDALRNPKGKQVAPMDTLQAVDYLIANHKAGSAAYK
jgi:ribosome-associated protein YbcJ (S4-like RNA binding protein)